VKILYIIDQTNLFGSELHVFDLIKKLGPLNQITLIAFNNGPLINMIKELNLNITVIVIDLSWFPNAFKLLKLINQVKNISPNIIHSHQPKAILYGSIIAKFVGKKHISTIHSIPYVSASIYKGLKHTLVKIFHTSVQFTAELFSTKSIFLTNYNKKRYSFFKKKSIVLYNWVSNRFNIAGLSSEQKTDSHSKIHFLAIGSITRVKGFWEMLQLLNNIKETVDFELLVVGKGDAEFENTLHEFVADNDLSDRVFFLGYQSNLNPLYQSSDCFILLPKEETFGLVFIEAMQFGLPVICSDIPQLREIIPPENIFVKNGQTLAQEDIDKICDKEYRERIGHINKSVSEKLFNIDVQIKLVSDLYLSLT